MAMVNYIAEVPVKGVAEAIAYADAKPVGNPRDRAGVRGHIKNLRVIDRYINDFRVGWYNPDDLFFYDNNLLVVTL